MVSSQEEEIRNLVMIEHPCREDHVPRLHWPASKYDMQREEGCEKAGDDEASIEEKI